MKIHITDNGSTWSFRALDASARAFLHSVGAESWQFLGRDTLVIDHRIANDFVAAAQDNEDVEFTS